MELRKSAAAALVPAGHHGGGYGRVGRCQWCSSVWMELCFVARRRAARRGPDSRPPPPANLY